MKCSATTYCGKCAIVGRPNVGKSSLLNAIIGTHVSITSGRPQTTRGEILGIHTQPPWQTIYVDTPGMQPSPKRAMEKSMNRIAARSTGGAAMILMLVEAMGWKEADSLVLDRVREKGIPVLLGINKIDRLHSYREVLSFIEREKDRFPFHAFLPFSVKKRLNLDRVIGCIQEHLPVGAHLIDPACVTLSTCEERCAEWIRKSFLGLLGQELPFSLAVEIIQYESSAERLRVAATIWVERESQKPIVIGAKGAKIKEATYRARRALASAVHKEVHLSLWVKISPRWTEQPHRFAKFLYRK